MIPGNRPRGEPLISFIMPVYDPPVDRFTTALDCVLDQASASWELILVDDGSSDPHVLELITRATNSDPRVRTLRQENQGPSKARNLGTSHARGTYVMYVDADDELTTHVVDDVQQAAQADTPDLILGFLQSVQSHGDKSERSAGTAHRLTAEERERFYLFNLSGRADALFQKDAQIRVKIGPVVRALRTPIAQSTPFAENLVVSEDTVWNLDMLARVESITLVNSIWYWYWTVHESTSRGYRDNASAETASVIHAVAMRAANHSIASMNPAAVLARILGEANRAIRTHYARPECPLTWRQKTHGIKRLLDGSDTRPYMRFGIAKNGGWKLLVKYLLSRGGLLLPYWTVRYLIDRARHATAES